jgi:hypothetical protein
MAGKENTVNRTTRIKRTPRNRLRRAAGATGGDYV